MRTKAVKFIIAVVGILLIAIGGSTMAQESSTEPRTENTFSFNDFGFTYPTDWVTAIVMQYVAGDPVEDAVPAFSDATHIGFSLYDPFPVEGEFDQKGSIRLYTTQEIAKYDFLQAELDELYALLENRPDLAEYEAVRDNVTENALPYIPVLPHGQIIRAQAEYVETDQVRGIRFITSHRADAGPFVTTDLVYTFQGVSTDGLYYVSASFPMTTTLFDATLPADYDPTTFEVTPYLTEAVARINAASTDQFRPSLDWLDGIVTSFSFNN